ncbi:MAG: nuclear transport factor 2 family protein [Ilumatobacter sp.]|uniref:nuclear transport factor 2 family protein n=1 Tax=Ilumatobacter sp. TaxID=1967498 RepID=UPI003C7512FA
MSENDPINGCIERWHEHMAGRLDGGLDAVLHQDVVFLSPIVFTPQKGIDITKAYLGAAGGTLGGDEQATDGSGSSGGGGFRYTKEILDGHHAVLEFETSIDGKYVNGIDMMTCDDDGMITEFKVMIRPLQAINLVHAQMKTMLEKMAGQT